MSWSTGKTLSDSSLVTCTQGLSQHSRLSKIPKTGCRTRMGMSWSTGKTLSDSSVEMASISHRSCSALSCAVSSSASRSATRMLCHLCAGSTQLFQRWRRAHSGGLRVLRCDCGIQKMSPCTVMCQPMETVRVASMHVRMQQSRRNSGPNKRYLEAGVAEASAGHATVEPGATDLAQQALQRAAFMQLIHFVPCRWCRCPT